MLHRLQAMLAVACLGACLSPVCGSAAKSETPPDLLLGAAEIARSAALSNFAWGLLLQLEAGDQNSTDFLAYYEKALRLAPESRVVLEHLVTPWLVERRVDKIVEVLAPVADAHPEQPHLLLVLVQALVAQGKSDEAIMRLQRVLHDVSPAEPAVFRELFLQYWRLKKYDAIAALLRRARWKPGLKGHFVLAHAAGIYHHAMAHLPEREVSARERARRERRARRHARQALERLDQVERPADIESLADLLIALSAWPELIRLLEFARADAEFAAPELNLMLADALQREERPDEALAVLDDVGDDPGVRPHFMAELGRLYHAAGRLEEAAAAYERALTGFPRATEIRFRLAFLALRLGRPHRTLEVLEKIEKLPPEGHLLRSQALGRMQRNEDAAKAVLQAEQLALEAKRDDFFTVDFYLYYATLCEELGYTDRGLEKVRQAMQLAPDDPVVLNFLGYVLADHNRELTTAEQLIARALAAEPDNFAYIDSQAWVFYRQGRFAQALVTINRALRLAGAEPDPVILDHAGDICAKNDLDVLARKYWLDALGAGADNAVEIQRKLGENAFAPKEPEVWLNGSAPAPFPAPRRSEETAK